MAGIYNTDQSAMLKIQEVGDTIFVAESTKTPFSRLLKRGKKPVQELCQWPVQKYPDRAFTGTLDGADVSSYTHTSREYMEAYCMILRTAGWQVTQLAGLTRTAGVKDEKAKQKADDALILAQMIEKQLLSSVDTQAESGSDPYQSRGVFSWLNSSAQSNKPVPANYRPDSACHYTSAVASYTPENMATQLAAMADAKKGPVTLTMFAGLTLKSTMSTWPQRQFGDDNVAKSLVNFTIDAEKKKFMQIVDLFQFDAGTVDVVPSWYLLATEATGAASAYSAKSGAMLDLSMWELCFLQAPQSKENPDLGGGPRGYHDAVYILKCLNPLGQGYVLTNS